MAWSKTHYSGIDIEELIDVRASQGLQITVEDCELLSKNMIDSLDNAELKAYEVSCEADNLRHSAQVIEDVRSEYGANGDEPDIPYYTASRLMNGRSVDDILLEADEKDASAGEILDSAWRDFQAAVEKFNSLDWNSVPEPMRPEQILIDNKQLVLSDEVNLIMRDIEKGESAHDYSRIMPSYTSDYFNDNSIDGDVRKVSLEDDNSMFIDHMIAYPVVVGASTSELYANHIAAMGAAREHMTHDNWNQGAVERVNARTIDIAKQVDSLTDDIYDNPLGREALSLIYDIGKNEAEVQGDNWLEQVQALMVAFNDIKDNMPDLCERFKVDVERSGSNIDFGIDITKQFDESMVASLEDEYEIEPEKLESFNPEHEVRSILSDYPAKPANTQPKRESNDVDFEF